MVVLDLEKVKIKNMSNGENLSEAPKDGIFETFLEYYHERSSVLLEPTQFINIGTTKKEKTLHLATSMTEQENSEFVKFFEDISINFTWSYSDMLGLDPDLLMHHLSLPSIIKPMK